VLTVGADDAPAAGAGATRELDELARRLEEAATRLRSSALDADEAAELIDECASLAARASGELERLASGEAALPRAAPASGQEPLAGPHQDSLL
jgi:hypothetical protein